METENCCVGKALNEECDKTFHCRIKGRIQISNIANTDAELLTQRTGHTFEPNKEICFHPHVYISKYEALQKYCFDPFKSHKKKINKGLCKVDMKTATKVNMKPGLKLYALIVSKRLLQNKPQMRVKMKIQMENIVAQILINRF